MTGNDLGFDAVPMALEWLARPLSGMPSRLGSSSAHLRTRTGLSTRSAPAPCARRRCSWDRRRPATSPGRRTCINADDWTHHHAGHLPLGRQRRQLSHRAALVLYRPPVGDALLVYFRHHLYCPADGYCVAGDEVIVTKAGKHPHGLDRFFSSLYGKPVPGLAFFTLSLVSLQKRRSFPMRIEQVVRSDAEKAASKAKAAAKKPTGAQAPRRPGRPKGRTNAPKAAATLTPELMPITSLLTALLQLRATLLSVTSLGLDGALWQPQRPADGAPVRLTPHFQAAVRCGAVFPLYWSLCGARSPAQVWPQGGL